MNSDKIKPKKEKATETNSYIVTIEPHNNSVKK